MEDLSQVPRVGRLVGLPRSVIGFAQIWDSIVPDRVFGSEYVSKQVVWNDRRSVQPPQSAFE